MNIIRLYKKIFTIKQTTMTSLETAQLKLECLKIAERTSPLKLLENAKAYYEWIMLAREETTTKAYVDRGNSNLGGVVLR